MKIDHRLSQSSRLLGFWGGTLSFFFLTFFIKLDPGNPQISYTLAVAILMAFWWIFEVAPLAVTALLPIILFPAMGIMDGKDVSSAYFNHVIFLFIGGFIVAIAMQRWDLHKRIALKILMYTGISPARILLGFMFATAFLSMWISNTATTMMMIPILISIINKLEESLEKEEVSKYSLGLLLGVAYSASIGGIATLVGTPPNLSFARIFQIMFPEAPEISFANWFLFALPLSIVFFVICWLYLYYRFRPAKNSFDSITKEEFRTQYKELGPVGREEKIVLVDFVLLALCWLTRSDVQIGNIVIPGWSDLFSEPSYFNDGTVAIIFSVVLFLIPAKNDRIMNWNAASKIPWNIVLLFGGGFALASGFKESGLSFWIGEQLIWIDMIHPFLIVVIISFGMTFLTELTSNTATTEMILPILAGIAVSIQINPLLLMIPATISASMAFMLPVATPPNAIVFGTNRIRMMDMVKTGIILNLLGTVLISLATYFLARLILNIDPAVFPDWAFVH